MNNENYGKDYVRKKLKLLKKILIWFFGLMFLGVIIGTIMGGLNPLLIFWPPTWIHIFKFFI